MLALDLDGTLLNSGQRISESSKLWIHRAIDAGVTVIFATGRGLYSTEAYWEELNLHAPMVLLNGAEIWEGRGKLWKRFTIPSPIIRSLHKLAANENVQFWGNCGDQLVGAKNWSDEFLERDWTKFGIRDDNPEVLSRIAEHLLGWGILQIVSESYHLELSAKGITKASGVKEVCKLLGIGMQEVMAIGDSKNDLDMLRECGLGVAMGNAADIIKQAAHVITESNDREGVALAIERYLFNNVVSKRSS
jgi:hydroxymethylpyrimidine pyrophosphatase-like HAD family hydrolase